MGVTGAMNFADAAMSIAGTATNIYGSIQQGRAERTQAEANAQIYEAQAKNIKEAQKITDRQYRTRADVLRGQATTTAARNGLKISGTTASSISQSIMQLQMDNSYEQYNLKVQQHNAYSNAILERYQGKMAYTNGLMRAGNSALNASVNFMDKYWKKPKKTEEEELKVKNVGTLSGGFATTNEQIFRSSIGDRII